MKPVGKALLRSSPNHSFGYTLIEVLVTVLLFSVATLSLTQVLTQGAVAARESAVRGHGLILANNFYQRIIGYHQGMVWPFAGDVTWISGLSVDATTGPAASRLCIQQSCSPVQWADFELTTLKCGSRSADHTSICSQLQQKLFGTESASVAGDIFALTKQPEISVTVDPWPNVQVIWHDSEQRQKSISLGPGDES